MRARETPRLSSKLLRCAPRPAPCCICRAGSLGAGLQGRTARLWLRVVNVRYAETGCCCMCMLLCVWGAEGRCNG
jgi:hypothetical protein